MRERLKVVVWLLVGIVSVWAESNPEADPQMMGMYPSDGQPFFVCHQSGGGTIPLSQVCDGYPHCPSQEDETICSQDGGGNLPNYGPPSFMVPDVSNGLVRLPDHLQQKQYYESPNNLFPANQPNDRFGDFRMDMFRELVPEPSYPMPRYPMSSCSAPPPQSACPLPWARPSDMYYFNNQASTCQQFNSYSSCGGQFNPNQFNTFDECINSCTGAYPEMVQPLPDPQQSGFYCQDGSVIGMDRVCNGMPDCMYGDDEAGCGTNIVEFQPPPVQTIPMQQEQTPLVIVLTASNYEMTIRAHPRIVVKFFSTKCPKCQEFMPVYNQAVETAKSMNLGITFAKVDCDIEPLLKERFGVDTYPKILYYDASFPMGMPRQYYKSYGLTANGLLTWLQKQIMSTQAPTMVIPCNMGEFQCGNGQCLQENLICDGVYQCRDGSDEQMCAPKEVEETHIPPPPPPPQPNLPPPEENLDQAAAEACDFQCRNGACQPMKNRCDGKNDCPEGIDEENCIPYQPAECTRTEFACRNGEKCIEYLKRCDGRDDCQDDSDEFDCAEAQCSRTDFICEDLACINFALRCDGKFDCEDRSDEYQCPPSCDPNTQFTCNNGRCIGQDLRCDGTPQCQDSTDEIGCGAISVPGECDEETQWECANHRRCIDKRRLCDGYPDCPDQSDEDAEMCPKVECGEEWQFQCRDKQRCIDKRRRCDGYSDCLDESDENDCFAVECDYWQFKCRISGLCIDTRRRCDGTNDCGSDEDEQDCDNITENPFFSTNEIEEPVPTTVSPISIEVLPEDDCPTFCPSMSRPVCGTDGLTYENECRLKAMSCSSDQEIQIYYEGPCETEEDPVEPQGCAVNQWQCLDGSCIYLKQQCDRKYDCRDGEDEKYCSIETIDEIPDSYFACYNGQQFPVSLRCDGTPDCPDGEDEISCEYNFEPLPQVYPPPNCDPLDEFTCKDGSCRPIDTRCDGMVDCEDESDEFDCPLGSTSKPSEPEPTTADPFEYEEELGTWFEGDDYLTEGVDTQEPEDPTTTPEPENPTTPYMEPTTDGLDYEEATIKFEGENMEQPDTPESTTSLDDLVPDDYTDSFGDPVIEGDGFFDFEEPRTTDENSDSDWWG